MRTRTQRSLLLAFVISIAWCGVVGIYCLLMGRMGRIEERILGTAAVVGGASILGLACAVPWERRRWHPLGPIGVLSIMVAMTLLLVAIWANPWRRSPFYHVMGVSCVIGIALPHVGVLSIARLKRQYGWVRRVTIVSIVLLAASITYVILGEPRWPGFQFWERLIGILSIAVACGTIAVPIMHRVSAIRAREDVKTVELALTLTCPRCEKSQQLPAGRSRCKQCGLKFRIDIEEDLCRTCGYPLYRLTSAVCPECGTPIAEDEKV